MSMTIEVDARALQSAFERAPAKVVSSLQDWVDKTAARSERTGKQEAPVDKGRLQSSIHMNLGMLNAVVKPNVNYAEYVHNGTGIYGPKRRPIRAQGHPFAFSVGGKKVFAWSIRGQRANPFMDRTYNEVKPVAQREGQLTLDRLVRSI